MLIHCSPPLPSGGLFIPVNELAQINAKLDMVLSVVTALAESLRATEKPMTQVAFAKRVGLSRWTISDRIKSGQILTRHGMIPPSELRKFGL